MKKIILGCILCMPLLFISCSDDDNKGNVHVESITILDAVNDTLVIVGGADYQIKYETFPANSPVKFYSVTPGTFRVNENTGLIMAPNGGVGKIIAMAQNGEGFTQVVLTVMVNEYIEEIKVIEGREVRILPTGTSASVASDFEISPPTATNKKLTYTSSDPNIVTVDENGLVRHVSRGVAQIIALATDAGEVVSEPISVYSGYVETKLAKTGWVATATSTQPGTMHSTSNMIDNSTYSYWHANWNTPDPYPYYAMIDMKSVKSFSKIVLTRRSDYADNRDMEYHISPVATDGLSASDPSFTKLTEYTFGDQPRTVRTHTYNVFPTVVQTRYLKIMMLNSNRDEGAMSIAEVDIYAVVEG